MIPAVFALLLLSQVAAQTSNVTTCIPSYDWSLNSNDQTPCLVAAILENICDGPVEVNTIPQHNHYILTDANLCQCNTVTYSLISACGGCQNRTFISWTDWATNCTQVEPVGQFLQTIPPDVAVPSWAYLNVTKTNNTFDPVLANQSISNAASAGLVPTSSSSIPVTISSTTHFTTPPSSPTPHNKVDAGAIAGGVVGGVAGLVAISLAFLFCFRRRNAPLEEFSRNSGSLSTSPPPMQEFGGRRSAASPHSITPFPYERFRKEPSETETFPGSPVTSAVHTTFDTSSVSTPAVQVLHRFTGSAEV